MVSGRTWLSSCKKPQRPARTSGLYCLCRKTGWQITDSHLRSFHSSHEMCRKRFRFPGRFLFDVSVPLSVPVSSSWYFWQISRRISRAWRFSWFGRKWSAHLCKIICTFCRDCNTFGNIIKNLPTCPARYRYSFPGMLFRLIATASTLTTLSALPFPGKQNRTSESAPRESPLPPEMPHTACGQSASAQPPQYPQGSSPPNPVP